MNHQIKIAQDKVSTALKPLFMWAGGKRRLLPKYAPWLPAAAMNAYVEPFLGGAAVFAAMVSRQPGLHAVLGDVNEELIGLYRAVRDRPARLVTELKKQEHDWLALSVAERKKLYYALREHYWKHPTPAQLYFLLKTGFNGIWQTCEASHGLYGTPVGLANQCQPFIDEILIRQWSKALAHAQIQAQPYEDTNVPNGAFVYCDPPYRGSFTSYGQVFDDAHQEALIAWCKRTAQTRRALVWLSNRETGDGFFERHTQGAELARIPVIYTAGRRKRTTEGFEAKPAVEILLIWDGRR